MDFAFNKLSLKKVYLYTVVDNAPVNSFHESCGCRRVQAQADRFTIGGNGYDAIRHECDFLEWAAIRETLVVQSDRIARRILSYGPRR
jgi:RimJ/RimL family protein N-acetyltransferase